MLLCMLEAVEVSEVMRCVLLCMLDAVWVLFAEAMRCMLLCILEVMEMMRCATLYVGGCGG